MKVGWINNPTALFAPFKRAERQVEKRVVQQRMDKYLQLIVTLSLEKDTTQVLEILMQVRENAWEYLPHPGLQVWIRAAPAAQGEILRIMAPGNQGAQTLNRQLALGV